MPTLPRQQFLSALKSTAAAADKRPTTPILGMVHLSFGGDTLTLSAQTQSCHVAVSIPAPGCGTDAYCVDPVTLIGALSKVSGADVTLTPDHDKGRVAIACGGARYNLVTSPGADYPVPPTVPADVTITMPASALSVMLARVVPSLAPDDNRYGLSGVHMERVGGGGSAPRDSLRLVTTDGNRLTHDEAPATITGELPRRMLLPSAVVRVLAPMLAGASGDVTLSIGERSVRVTVAGAVLTGRLMEADFPDYRQVLPTSFKRIVKLDRTEFTAAIQAVAPMAGDASHTVRMEFGDDGVKLSARKVDSGDAEIVCSAELAGEELTTGVNAAFVLDSLAGMSSDAVKWSMGDALHPIIAECDGSAARFVLMPVRLDG